MSGPRAWWARLRRPDPHTLAGASALDALTSADRRVFERHLAGCESCQAEAASLREAAARLGTAAAAAPPPGLRERVLAGLPGVRQLPPVVDGQQARIRRGMPWLRALRLREPWLRAPWLRAPRLAVAAAVVCLLLVLASGTLMVGAQHRLTAERSRTAAITAVLNAPDATMMTGRGRHGGTATVVMSHARRSLVLTTARLPSLPGTQRYEVWLMGPQGTRAAGMLPAARHGMTSPMIVSGLAAGDELALTAGPASGAPRPAVPMVLMLNLPS